MLCLFRLPLGHLGVVQTVCPEQLQHRLADHELADPVSSQIVRTRRAVDDEPPKLRWLAAWVEDLELIGRRHLRFRQPEAPEACFLQPGGRLRHDQVLPDGRDDAVALPVGHLVVEVGDDPPSRGGVIDDRVDTQTTGHLRRDHVVAAQLRHSVQRFRETIQWLSSSSTKVA